MFTMVMHTGRITTMCIRLVLAMLHRVTAILSRYTLRDPAHLTTSRTENKISL